MKIKKVFLHVFYSSEPFLNVQWKRYSSIILKGGVNILIEIIHSASTIEYTPKVHQHFL